MKKSMYTQHPCAYSQTMSTSHDAVAIEVELPHGASIHPCEPTPVRVVLDDGRIDYLLAYACIVVFALCMCIAMIVKYIQNR